jgi:THO complex subunit 4
MSRSSYSILIRCRAAAAGRGRRPRGRGGARKAERPPKTAADLDAEMEVRTSIRNAYLVLIIPLSIQDYTAANAPAAAA